MTSIEDVEETRLNRVITEPMLTFFILGDILGAGIVTRRTGTVVAEQDLTTGPEDDDRP